MKLNLAELREKAESARFEWPNLAVRGADEVIQYVDATSPATVLALIDRIERLTEQRNSWIKNSPIATIKGIVQDLIRGEDAEVEK